IHVDHDWNGAHLLSILENGRTKALPYEDDFSVDRGWIVAWGLSDIGRNNFSLKATPQLTSASTFLDGSELWGDYSFDVASNWHDGYIFVLGDVINSKTYDTCVFSPGQVQIQTSINGESKTIATQKDPRIQYGDNVSGGIRLRGSSIECTWNFSTIAQAYERSHSGGVGLQIWN